MRHVLFAALTLWGGLAPAASLPLAFYGQDITVHLASSSAAAACGVSLLPLAGGATDAVSVRLDDNKFDDLPAHALMLSRTVKGTFYLNDPAGYHANDSGQAMTDPSLLDGLLLPGGNSIGSHSLTHPHLMDLDANRVFEEVCAVRALREASSQSAINSFAVPFENYKSAAEGLPSQQRLDESLQRSGYLHTASDWYNYSYPASPLLFSTLLPTDGAAISTAYANLLAQARPAWDKPLFTVNMHAVPSYWGGNAFPVLDGELATVSGGATRWYCNANEYAAYRTQYFRTQLTTQVSGNDVLVHLQRPDPLDLGSLQALTLELQGITGLDLVGVDSAGASLAALAGQPLAFDLPHGPGQLLPVSFSAQENSSGATALLAASLHTPEIQAVLYLQSGSFVLKLKNISGSAIGPIQLRWRLPLQWVRPANDGLASLAAGATQSFSASPALDSDIALNCGDAWGEAQIDYQAAGVAKRLHAGARLPVGATTAQYIRGHLRLLGPYASDRGDFNAAQFESLSALAETDPGACYPSFLSQSLCWHAPSVPNASWLHPDIAPTTGEAYPLDYSNWASDYYSYGHLLHWVCWTSVYSPNAQTAYLQDFPGTRVKLHVNGADIAGSSFMLQAGDNDLKLVYTNAAGAGWDERNWGAFVRLNDSGGSRLSNIAYKDPIIPAPAATATPSPTPQNTATPGPQAAQTLASDAAPNPTHGKPWRFGIKLDQPADRVTLRLYSSGASLAAESSASGSFSAGWNAVSFSLPALAGGLYYYRLQVQNGGGRSSFSMARPVYFTP